MKKIILSIFLLSVVLPTLAFASFDTSLHYGAKGDAVTDLQNFLQTQGLYSGTIDGSFGSGTMKAVEAFQSANGLQVDGRFGIGSRTKANSLAATTSDATSSATSPLTQPQTSTQPSMESGSTGGLMLNVNGCSLVSLYSITTGLPCNSSGSTATSATTPATTSASTTSSASGTSSLLSGLAGCAGGTATPTAACAASIMQNLNGILSGLPGLGGLGSVLPATH